MTGDGVRAVEFVGATLLVACLLLGGLSVGVHADDSTGNDGNVTVYRANDASVGNATAIERAIENGTVAPANDVTVEDTLVVAIESERLSDDMNATDGSATRRFFATLDGDAEFRVVQTNPTPEKNRKIASLGRENVTVRRGNSTVYVVVETRNLTFGYRRVDRSAEILGGERFAVQFGYDLADTWSRATVPSSPIVEFHRPDQLTPTPSTTTPSTETEPSATVTTTPEPTAVSETKSATVAETTGSVRENTSASEAPGFTAVTALVASLFGACCRALLSRTGSE